VAYGTIASLPAWSNALQIVLIPTLSRFLTPKDLAVGIGWLNIGLWSVFAAVLGYLPVDEPRRIIALFYIFFALTSLSQSLIGIGWTSWVREWVPRPVRGTYFGHRNRLISLVTVAFLILTMALFKIAPDSLWPYQALIGGAVFLRYGSLLWQYGIRTDSDRVDPVSQDWIRQIRDALQSRELLVFICFSAWTNFWLGFVGPFYPVFCFEELGLTAGNFTTLVILGSLAGMVAYAWWGRQVDRLGSLPILGVGLFLWEIQNYLWCILSPQTTWLLYPMWLWGGFFGVAYLLGSFSLLLKLILQSSRLAATSLYVAITSMTAALAPILAGALLNRFLPLAENRLDVYHLGFGVKTTAVLFGLFALRNFKEPARSTRGSAPGAFRPLRTLLTVLGPGFLPNFTPLSRRKK